MAARRTIYRQDVVDAPAATPAPAPAPVPAPNKLTLILHPAPKAAPWKKKKESRPMTAKEALKAKAHRLAQPGAAKPDKPAAGPAALDPGWLAAPAEQALDAVRSAGDAAEELVQSWLDRGNHGAIAQIAALDPAAATGATSRARKAARRALHVLRSRGVAIEQAGAPAPRVVAAEEPGAVTASYIPPDGSGTSFFSLSQRMPGGRYRVADVLVRDDAGVVHASAGLLAGKHIRRWKNRVEQRFGCPPIEVPLDWARWAIAQARRKNDQTKQLVPLGFEGCLALATPPPEAAPAHPVAALEASEPSQAEIEKSALDSGKLHGEPEFRTWVPDRSALDELVVKVGERLSADPDDRELVGKAIEEQARAATDRFFTPERRAVIAERMRDAAISVRARLGDDRARRVLALAQAIRQAGLVTHPPHEIPFLLGFFEKGIAMLAAEGRGQLRVPVRQASA